MKLLMSHEDYIESERDKINNGTTINGVHVSGLHYFYLCYVKVNGVNTIYKDLDREFFQDYINYTIPFRNSRRRIRL